MSNREDLLTPVGRLVQGSLYDPQTTDAEGRPLTIRSGVNQGQPRVDYYFGIAVPKGTESHWNETEWGAKIWAAGHAGFPNGQTQSPTFAWKVLDGDSTIPNKVGRRPCDREGFPGHWVMNFSSGFAPGIYNSDGSKQLLDKNAVNLGDYIQVFGNVSDNGSIQQPGIFLNHSMVALVAYGSRIIVGADPKAVGFGKNVQLPPGASLTPQAQAFNPVSPEAAVKPPVPTPAPYPQILTPPVPPTTPAPRVMTAAADGITYEAYIANGWTDELLIQHGKMLA